MKKIFYAEKNDYPVSENALREIFATYFQIPDPVFARTKNGKPYLKSPLMPVFFSVTHTDAKLFIALSDKEIGIDAESVDREIRYASVVKRKFFPSEQNEIHSSVDFLRLWTIKESAVKQLGGTIGKDLKKIRYENGVLFYDQAPLSAKISLFFKDEHIICVCSETSFQDAEWIPLPFSSS